MSNVERFLETDKNTVQMTVHLLKFHFISSLVKGRGKQVNSWEYGIVLSTVYLGLALKNSQVGIFAIKSVHKILKW